MTSSQATRPHFALTVTNKSRLTIWPHWHTTASHFFNPTGLHAKRTHLLCGWHLFGNATVFHTRFFHLFHNSTFLFSKFLTYGRWYAHLFCKLWVISHRLHKSFLLG
jgi:hypothetical protein